MGVEEVGVTATLVVIVAVDCGIATLPEDEKVEHACQPLIELPKDMCHLCL